MDPNRFSENGRRISRREAMRRGLGGATAALLAGGLVSDASADAAKPGEATAKSVIQVFLWGGMSHNDTWDPKPEAGREYMGDFMQVIPTKEDGFSQLMPQGLSILEILGENTILVLN